MLDQFVKDPANKVKVGTNAANFGECVGLVQKWFGVVGASFFYGNAKDLYANAPFEFTKGITWPAPKGAATVYDGSWGGGKGHTQLSVDGKGLVMEQNNPVGTAPHLHTYASRPPGYIGYILPKSYKEGDEMLTEDNVRFLYLAVTGAGPTDAQVKYWVGRSLNEFDKALYKLSDDYLLAAQKQLAAVKQPKKLDPGVYEVK